MQQKKDQNQFFQILLRIEKNLKKFLFIFYKK